MVIYYLDDDNFWIFVTVLDPNDQAPLPVEPKQMLTSAIATQFFVVRRL